MIFASDFDRRKVNPLVYVKLWKQASLPSLLFGAELWTLTPTLLLKLERCQYWFLKHIFYVPEFATGSLQLKLSGLNSIESEVATKKLLLLGRLITELKEGVGCTEASFTILEAINHMIESGSNVFTCFVDVRKAFDTVWIDGLLLKLFFEFGIKGRMWLALRSLYTGMKAHVLCFGSLSRKFDILQGTGQGRVLAPFMYKVYINDLLTELTSHSCAPSLNNLSLPSPSFADDTSLLSIYPSFQNVFMQICYDYSLKWQSEFNHSKSGVIAFGERRLVHCIAMKERKWILDDDNVNELYEYKNLGVVKNYIGSFSSNVEENIDKTA